MSLGSDGQMLRWHCGSGRNTLVHYHGVTCKERLPMRPAVSSHAGLPVVRRDVAV